MRALLSVVIYMAYTNMADGIILFMMKTTTGETGNMHTPCPLLLVIDVSLETSYAARELQHQIQLIN